MGAGTSTLQQSPSLTQHTDSGYVSGERQYRVTALDPNSVPSAARDILLPNIQVTYPINLEIRRGIMNRLSYTIQNNGGTNLTGLKLTVNVGGHISTSAPFTLTANETRIVPVVVGGFDNLTGVEDLRTTVEVTPNPRNA